MHIPAAVFFGVAFIMIFTYTSVAVIYGDYSEYNINKNNLEITISIWEYIDFNFEIAKDELIYNSEQGFRIQYALYYNNRIFNMIKDDYNAGTPTGHDFFDQYVNARQWWTYHPAMNPIVAGLDNRKLIIGLQYENYLKDNGYDIDAKGDFVEYEKNAVELILGFIGTITDGFGNVLDLATFNFQNSYGDEKIDPYVRMILSIFFIPMWIILILGLFSLAVDAVNAIGNLIPFT